MGSMTPAKFRIDGTQGSAAFEGFHEPEKRWNGWACPSFPMDTVRALAEWLNTEGDEQFHKIEIDNSLVQLTSALNTEDQWTERVPSQVIFTAPDAAVVVYSVGAYAWTWSVDGE
jgi:hypothetical protein